MGLRPLERIDFSRQNLTSTDSCRSPRCKGQSAKLSHLKFHPPEVVSPIPTTSSVGENYSYFVQFDAKHF